MDFSRKVFLDLLIADHHFHALIYTSISTFVLHALNFSSVIFHFIESIWPSNMSIHLGVPAADTWNTFLRKFS